jgi:hypothetical protein
MQNKQLERQPVSSLNETALTELWNCESLGGQLSGAGGHVTVPEYGGTDLRRIRIHEIPSRGNGSDINLRGKNNRRIGFMRIMKSITFGIVAHTSRETLPRNIHLPPRQTEQTNVVDCWRCSPDFFAAFDLPTCRSVQSNLLDVARPHSPYIKLEIF